MIQLVGYLWYYLNIFTKNLIKVKPDFNNIWRLTKVYLGVFGASIFLYHLVQNAVQARILFYLIITSILFSILFYYKIDSFFVKKNKIIKIIFISKKLLINLIVV